MAMHVADCMSTPELVNVVADISNKLEHLAKHGASELLPLGLTEQL